MTLLEWPFEIKKNYFYKLQTRTKKNKLLQNVAMVAKFLDGLPLYRLEKIIARDGLIVSRQNKIK